jgi:hypothetical protein
VAWRCLNYGFSCVYSDSRPCALLKFWLPAGPSHTLFFSGSAFRMLVHGGKCTLLGVEHERTPEPPPARSWDTSPLQHMDRSPDCSQGPESGEQEAGRGPVQQERNQINRTRRRSHSGIISPVRRLPNDPAQIQPGRRENGGSWLSGPK